jgi:integrase
MRRRKYNIELRSGRQGLGYYLDFTVRGHRFRAFGGKTLREAKLEIGRLRAEKTSEKSGPIGRDLTFAEFGQEFLEVYSKPNKRSWRRDVLSVNSLSSFFQGQTLRRLSAQDVERFKARRSTEVSAATTNRELACLRTLLNKAVEWGRLEQNPASRVKKLREAPPRERVLSAEEASRLIDKAAPHLKTILIVLLNTGMRRGEALGLRWENVDLDKGFIHICDSKNGKSRNVPMNAVVLAALHELKDSKTGDGFVFGGVKEIKRSFRTACKRANIMGLRIQDLRHTCASRLVQLGVDLVTVSKLLGHSSITMTMRYAHPTPENMRFAVEKLCDNHGIDLNQRVWQASPSSSPSPFTG